VVVNGSIRAPGCSLQTHARMRRSRSAFCMHCGERFDPGRWGR
jgi:hypothetical protein